MGVGRMGGLVVAGDDKTKIIAFREQSEMAVLGSALHGGEDGRAAEHLRPLLPVDAFALPAHVAIWQAIVDLVDNGRPVDAPSICDELTAQGNLQRVGGASYLSQCIDAVPIQIDIYQHVDSLLDAMRLRRADLALLRARASIVEGASSLDVATSAARIAETCAPAVGSPASKIRILRLAEIEHDEEATRWLVEDLWTEAGMGFIGGEPKVNKSIILLDLCAAVASGQSFIGHHIPTPGPVLLFAAEDPLRSVASRLRRICRARGLDQAELPIHIINENLMRLDDAAQRRRLRDTVMSLHPRMIALDPLRRLISGDENDSSIMAQLLGELRALGREAGTAIVIVHHFRKRALGDTGGRTAERLRGTGDIFAVGDCYWLVSQGSNGVRKVEVELREVPAPDEFEIKVEGQPGEPLRIVSITEADHDREAEELLMDVLHRGPMGVAELRNAVHDESKARGEHGMRNQEIDSARRRLIGKGMILERKESRKMVVEATCPGTRGTLGQVGQAAGMGVGANERARVPHPLGGARSVAPIEGGVGGSCPVVDGAPGTMGAGGVQMALDGDREGDP